MAQFTVTSPIGVPYSIETPAVVPNNIVVQKVQAIHQQVEQNTSWETIQQNESGGLADPAHAHNKKSGAEGSMQTLPKTLRDPGFGVTPAKDDSPAEMQRVGKDYYEAMTKKYNSRILGAMAYNWGPTKLDNWIANGRKWEEVPSETKDYVNKLVQRVIKKK